MRFLLSILLLTTTANATLYYNQDGSPNYNHINEYMITLANKELAKQIFNEIVKGIDEFNAHYADIHNTTITCGYPEWIEVDGQRFNTQEWQ